MTEDLKNLPIEQIENIVLEQTKFINFILKELKDRNKALEDTLGASYGKFIGCGTVYDKGVCVFREIKKELDQYLQIVRSELLEKYKLQGRRRK